MSHYYLDDENLKSNIRNIAYDYRGVKLDLKSDLGIFAKDRVDFGTNLLLNALDEKDLDNKKILDIGCGYGIIGISLAKRYKDANVHMVDINKRAIEICELNIKENKLNNIKAYISNAYENITGKFDTIITNPPIRAGKMIVQKIVLGSIDYLNDFGVTYVVIQKKQGAPSLIKELENIFKEIEILEKKSGYYIIKTVKKM